MKTTTNLVIIGALGRVKKGVEKYISKIPGNFRIPELQKIVLVGTAPHTRGLHHQELQQTYSCCKLMD